MLAHLSLFSGIGGIDLAADRAGFTTVGQCESDPHCRKVLAKHWPGVPIWEDVRELTGESFRERTGLERPTLVSGGFPCQGFSSAGKRKGTGDDRFLWPEFCRVVRVLRPRWVLGENVRGLLSISDGAVFGSILSDLADLGYRAGWACYGADEACGAPHRRDRVFIVGYLVEHAEGRGSGSRERRIGYEMPDGTVPRPVGTGPGLADPRLCTGRPEHGLELGVRGAGAGEPGGTVADDPGPERERAGGTRAGREGPSDVRVTMADPERGRSFNEAPGLPDRADRRTVTGPVGVFPPGPADLEAWYRLLCADPLSAPALTREEEAQLGVRAGASGLSRRMAGLGLTRRQKLKQLGNSVCPWQVQPVLDEIARIGSALKGDPPMRERP